MAIQENRKFYFSDFSSFSFDLELRQHYQNITGEAKSREYRQPIVDAGLNGGRIQFSLFPGGADRSIRHDYEGRVRGDTIVGTVHVGGASEPDRLQWRAQRIR